MFTYWGSVDSRKNVQAAAVRDYDGVGAVVSNCVGQCCAVPVNFETITIASFSCPSLQEDKTDFGCRVGRLSDHR
jgi:hypothetical protein